MTEEEFYEKVKETYGSRGIRQAKKMMNCTVVGDGKEEPLDKGSVLAQALMESFFICKEKAREKFTPKKYRKTKTA